MSATLRKSTEDPYLYWAYIEHIGWVSFAHARDNGDYILLHEVRDMGGDELHFTNQETKDHFFLSIKERGLEVSKARIIMLVDSSS